MSRRVYMGHLPYEAEERDVEKFLKGYGRVTSILMKKGFAFVEFDSSRDADDAIHDLNGKSLMGMRVLMEEAKSRPRHESGGGRYSDRGRGDDRFGGRGGGRGCYNCGREGHISRDCTDSRGGDRSLDRRRSRSRSPRRSPHRVPRRSSGSRSPVRKDSRSPARRRSRSPSPRKRSASPIQRDRSGSPRRRSPSAGERSPSPGR